MPLSLSGFASQHVKINLQWQLFNDKTLGIVASRKYMTISDRNLRYCP
jgi:hypothetical protein